MCFSSICENNIFAKKIRIYSILKELEDLDAHEHLQLTKSQMELRFYTVKLWFPLTSPYFLTFATNRLNTFVMKPSFVWIQRVPSIFVVRKLKKIVLILVLIYKGVRALRGQKLKVAFHQFPLIGLLEE